MNRVFWWVAGANTSLAVLVAAAGGLRTAATLALATGCYAVLLMLTGAKL